MIKFKSAYEMESFFASKGWTSLYYKALEQEHQDSKHIDGRSNQKTADRLLLWWNEENKNYDRE